MKGFFVSASVLSIIGLGLAGFPLAAIAQPIAQTEKLGTTVQVTQVTLTSTSMGLEIGLETQDSQPLSIDASQLTIQGNTLTAEIPNAVLSLAEGQPFQVEQPTADITRIVVDQFTENIIRIVVTGNDLPPQTKVTLKVGGYSYALNSKVDEPEEEIVVTGERSSGYKTDNTSTATGTNTSILETPVSVQVIPQEIIRDQQVTQIKDALSNVSGVSYLGDVQGRSGNTFILRGFSDAQVLRDGVRRFGASGENSAQPITEIANLERIEVLKGPASILYGAIEPGGLINLVAKEPLPEPFHEVEVQVGNRNLLRPRFDFSGPLTTDGKLLYRFNGLYQTLDSVRDLDQRDKKYLIAPALTWKISDRTTLKLSAEYIEADRPADFGLPSKDGKVVDVPFDRIITEPSDTVESLAWNIGYRLEHQLSPQWNFNNIFRYSYSDYDFGVIALPLNFDSDTNTVFRVPASQDSQTRNYTIQTNLIGEFTAGGIQHKLLTGVDYVRRTGRTFSKVDFTPSFLDVFNPTYGLSKPNEDELNPFGGDESIANNWGFFVQDQISIFDHLKLLAGVRYDTLSQTTTNLPGSSIEPGETVVRENALTPRVGLLYQITDKLSLYGNYSQSFSPNVGATTQTGKPLEPQTAQGYEFGIKAELLDRRLLTTLAYFDVTKQNVVVGDPDFPLFSINSGEQRSRGIEFDLTGELMPGWKIISSYAYTNAKITEDSDSNNVGNRLFGAPENAASLWTTYEIQDGGLKGLGLGLG